MTEIPQHEMIPLEAVALRHDAAAFPFAQIHAAAIAANWAREVAAQPALFDGKVLMHRDISLNGRALSGISHTTRFSSLLYWRRHRQGEEGVFHLFGVPVMVTSDNALVMGRMAGWTANAGQIYAPCGSLDACDVRDGAVDLEGNMVREVAEETGFDLAGAERDPLAHLYRMGNRFAVFRRYRIAHSAARAVAEFEAHLADDPKPELDRIITIDGITAISDAYPPHMAAFIHHHFGDGSRLPGHAADQERRRDGTQVLR